METQKEEKPHVNKRVQMWVSENFKKLVHDQIDIEKERGNFNCSETIATEIIYRKIMAKGGLKKE